VLGYDEKENKFRVKILGTDQEKLVVRLSLMFKDEDPDAF